MAGTSERDQQAPPRTSGLADPTRDIRLPPLPGTAGPELPPEWEALRSAATPRRPTPRRPPSRGTGADDTTSESLVDQPTDQLGAPPRRATGTGP